MSLSYENPVAWRRAGQILTGTFLLTLALGVDAMFPVNGGPVTQATTPDTSASPPKTLIISSPAVSDVLKMVDAKVDTSVIKAYIQNSTTTFNPSAGELIALKNHGVPDEILTAMLERGAQVRTQIAQGLQKPPPVAPTYAAPMTTPALAPESTPVSYPADYSGYGAPYADYSYAYPYGYSYPYSYWWYNYSYPYYSYYWPYCGYYGHSYCGYPYYGHYGYCYAGHSHGNGHWNGNHPSPHSTGTFVNHSGGSGRPGAFAPVGTQSRPANFAMNRSPVSPVAARTANFAMNRAPSVPMSTGARPASFARAGGFSAGHAGGGARMGGGGGHVGGGGHR